MNRYILFLILATACPVFSQNNKSIGIKLAGLAAHGPVQSIALSTISVKYTDYQCTDERSRTTDHSSIAYDEYGRIVRWGATVDNDELVECTTYNPLKRIAVMTGTIDGKPDFHVTTAYDINGNILWMTESSSRWESFRTSTYSYDIHGKIIEYRHARAEKLGDTLTHKYLYDRSGQCTTEIYHLEPRADDDTLYHSYQRVSSEETGRGSYTIMTDTWSDVNNGFYQCATSDSGKLLWERRAARIAEGPICWWLNTYDSLGRLVISAEQGYRKLVNEVRVDTTIIRRGSPLRLTTIKHIVDTSMWQVSFFSYDMHGNPIGCDRIVYNSYADFEERRTGELKWRQTVEYSYDSYGNWIEAVVSTDGNIHEKFLRDITYYPGGYKTDEEFIPRHELR